MSAPSALLQLTSLLRSGSGDNEICESLSSLVSETIYSPDDIASLALVLGESGEKLSDRRCSIADVASTGGPSSLSTLLTPLFLRAAKVKVAKLGIPGRPAGGIDSLSQIVGFRSHLLMAEADHVLDDTGYVHFLAQGDAAPLDGKLFRLRQMSGTQEVPALVIASILAKKIAVRATHAGLDIRVSSHGNFGKDWNTAASNARLFNSTARLLHIEPAPVLTDGRFLYQPFLGRSESLVALSEIFSGKAGSWLLEHFHLCRTLAQACLPIEMKMDLAEITPSDLKAVFYRHIAAQGATASAFEDLVAATKLGHTSEIVSSNDGYCSYSLSELRSVLAAWQKPLATPKVPFPDPVGIFFHRRQGEWVSKGTPIATVRATNELKDAVQSCLSDMLARRSPISQGPTFEMIYG